MENGLIEMRLNNSELPSNVNKLNYPGCFTLRLAGEEAELDVSRHVFECLGLAIPMPRLGLGP